MSTRDDDNHEDTPTASMVYELPDRHDLLGLDVINTATGTVETFIAFSAEEIDFVGMVESREKSYAGTEWSTRRVYRTTTRPAEATAAMSVAAEYVELVARIHEVYRHLVMDTEADQTLHARHIETADKALDLARSALSQATRHTTTP